MFLSVEYHTALMDSDTFFFFSPIFQFCVFPFWTQKFYLFQLLDPLNF